ncbi:MAG: hypothetical protein JWQ49_1418 [Edaphobacter sp.]|nr:hypothetical protein [Edaphobacter sp.]
MNILTMSWIIGDRHDSDANERIRRKDSRRRLESFVQFALVAFVRTYIIANALRTRIAVEVMRRRCAYTGTGVNRG